MVQLHRHRPARTAKSTLSALAIVLLSLLPSTLHAQRWTTLRPDIDTNRMVGTARNDTSLEASVEPLWGYRDERGRWAIEPQFARASEFRNGRALAAIRTDDGDERYGVIDEYGAWVEDPVLLGFPRYFNQHHRAPIEIDTTVLRFHEFPIYWRYVVDDGTIDGSAPLSSVSPSDTLSTRSPDSPTDSSNVLVIPPPRGFEERRLGEYSDYESYLEYGESGIRYCAMDSSWRITIWDIEKTIEPYALDGIDGGRIDRRWGIIGPDGRWLVEPRYEKILGMDSIPFLVIDSSRYWFVGPRGERYLGPFEEATPFVKGRSLARVDGKYGIIDTAGRWVQPSLFDSMKYDHVYIAKRDGRWHFFDDEGRQAIDIDFDSAPFESIHPMGGGSYWNVVRNGRWGAIHADGEPIAPLESEEPVTVFATFDYPMAWYYWSFKQGGRWGLRTSNDRIVHPANLAEAPTQLEESPMLFTVFDGRHYRLIDTSGNPLCPPLLDTIESVDIDRDWLPRYLVGEIGPRSFYVDLRDSSVHPYTLTIYRCRIGAERSTIQLLAPAMENHRYHRSDYAGYHLRSDSTFELAYRGAQQFKGRFHDRFRRAIGTVTSDSGKSSFELERAAEIFMDDYPAIGLSTYSPSIEWPATRRALFQGHLDSAFGRLRSEWERGYRPDDTLPRGNRRPTLTLTFDLQHLDSNRLAYRIWRTTNTEEDDWRLSEHITNVVVVNGSLRRLEWVDLFKKNVVIDSLHYCPSGGVVYGSREKLDCGVYTLGTGNFVLDEKGLRVEYRHQEPNERGWYRIEPYIIPYKALKKYMRPEVYALVEGS